MWPHRRQPTRLPRPWDSPGKNTGVGCHFLLQCRKVKRESEVAQLSLTLSDPMDCSPPGSPIPGILQARTLEWVAISFSSAGKWNVKAKSLSRVWLLVTPWTAAHQAPPSMGFFRQEYWSGLPLPSPFLLLDGCKCFVDPYLCGEPDLPAQCSPWEQDAEWNKPDTKGHMLSDLTCMKVLEYSDS